jgi:hypothetical protein
LDRSAIFAAVSDITAILYVAGIFGGIPAHPDALMTDGKLVEARHQTPPSSCSGRPQNWAMR